MQPSTKHIKEFNQTLALEQLQAQLTNLGFGQWIYSSVVNIHKQNNYSVNRVSSYPESFINDYNDMEFSKVDPSTPYWLGSHLPASYRKVRRSVSLTSQQKALMSLNKEHQVNKGIVIPLQNALGFKAVLALSFDGSIQDLNYYISEVEQELYELACGFNKEMITHHKLNFIQFEKPLLTPRKITILSLMAQGLLTKQIAHQLGISVNAVDQHIFNIKSDLQAKTTAQAVALGVQWQLI